MTMENENTIDIIKKRKKLKSVLSTAQDMLFIGAIAAAMGGATIGGLYGYDAYNDYKESKYIEVINKAGLTDFSLEGIKFYTNESVELMDLVFMNESHDYKTYTYEINELSKHAIKKAIKTNEDYIVVDNSARQSGSEVITEAILASKLVNELEEININLPENER